MSNQKSHITQPLDAQTSNYLNQYLNLSSSLIHNQQKLSQDIVVQPAFQEIERNSFEDRPINLSLPIPEFSQPKNQKNGTSEMKNLPKYIIKLFKSFFHKFQSLESNNSQMNSELTHRIMKLHNFQSQNRSKTEYTLKDLQLLINGDIQSQSQPRSDSNHQSSISHSNHSHFIRSALNKIIQDDLKKHGVLRNKKITQKLSYLNGLKIYRLRCRNSVTACRMASK